jgi:hypothetical protein
VAYLFPADPLREHRRAEAASAGVGEDGNAEIKVEILLSLYGDCTKERLKSTHCGPRWRRPRCPAEEVSKLGPTLRDDERPAYIIPTLGVYRWRPAAAANGQAATRSHAPGFAGL